MSTAVKALDTSLHPETIKQLQEIDKAIIAGARAGDTLVGSALSPASDTVTEAALSPLPTSPEGVGR